LVVINGVVKLTPKGPCVRKRKVNLLIKFRPFLGNSHYFLHFESLFMGWCNKICCCWPCVLKKL